MDSELVLIFGFVLTVLLMVLTFGTVAGQRSRQHKLERLEIQARIEEAKAAQAARPTEVQAHLEERVRVLERIATDGNSTLAAQIDQLRDLQQLDTQPQQSEVAR